MRTELFFIAQLWALRRGLNAFLTHMATSFSPGSLKEEKSRIRLILGFEHCDEKILFGHCYPMPSSILSIEPLAGSGVPLGFRVIPHQAIGVESLELMLPLVEGLAAGSSAITPLIVNMSQIPCHRVHQQSLAPHELEYCHKMMLKRTVIELGKVRFKGEQYIVLIDNPELLGHKNSALLERLYQDK